MSNTGGHDVRDVREPVMRALRAAIREKQMRGVSARMIHDWIDRQEAVSDLTEEEGAIAHLIVRHYTAPVWEALYPMPSWFGTSSVSDTVSR